MSNAGLLALVDHAHFERLGELVRELLPLAPELEVYSEAPQCLEAAPGSTLILVPRAEDADWLNINRPLFAARSLRVVLFCTRAVSVALARGAVDFMDWLSLRVECPPGPVPFAVAGLRCALAARAPGIVWTGGDLEANFAAARPRHGLRWVSAARPYEELVAQARALRPREWLAWTEVDGLFRLRRVHWAMAEARRRTRAILVEPARPSPGWWEVHGQMMDFGKARAQLNELGKKHPGRWAALLCLEPESVRLLEGIPDRDIQDDSLQEAILDGADPGLLVGELATTHGLVHEDRRLDGQVTTPAMRAGWMLRGAPSRREPGDVKEPAERVETLLRHTPLTADSWQEVALAALSAGDPDVATIWAHRAVELEPISRIILAQTLTAQGRFSEAEQLIREQLAHGQQPTNGVNDLLEIQLAQILSKQGRYVEAERLLRQFLGKGVQSAIESHLERTAMQSLASTLRGQGRLEEARQQEEEVLGLNLRDLGPEHRDTLATMSDLAATLRAQGQLEQARHHQERVLKVRLRTLGPEHSDTLTAMNNLSETLRAQGQLEQAHHNQERVLEMSLRTRGPEHPITLAAIQNLAATEYEQGRLDEARQHQERVVEISLRTLGPEHPDTLKTMNNLAATLGAQGRLDEARQHQERVVEISLRTLGPEHPDTLTMMNNLADTLREQGRLNEARQHQEQVVEFSLRTLGSEHPDTLVAIGNLASILRVQGQSGEARKHQERVLEVMRRVLGPEHPNTLTTMANLAQTYWDQNEYVAARVLEERALEGALRTWGEAHPSTLRFMSVLAMMLRQQGDPTGAEVLEKKVEKLRQPQKDSPAPPRGQ